MHCTSLCVAALLLAACGPSAAKRFATPGAFEIARDGAPRASIVLARNASSVAEFAARELRDHVKRITGADLPVVRDDARVRGSRILVGESAETRKLGLKSDGFRPQEYTIRYGSDTLVLMGRDKPGGASGSSGHALGTPASTSNGAPRAPEPPDMYDAQGTCYAVYDFLERSCGVRWYAPGEVGLVCPEQKTLVVRGASVRRSPAFRFRQGTYLPVYGILKEVWNSPSPEEVRLFACRMRLGGEPYAANHSFYGYYDRYWERSSQNPAAFEAERRDWFAKGYEGRPPQMCFTSDGFVKQVIQDAQDYFDGKGAKPGAQANGDFFALVPMDNSSWCKCPDCTAQLNTDEEKSAYFSNGWASDYIFGFANTVAKAVGKSHPGKFLAALAYSSYAYYPRHTKLESNIAVQLCLHVRNWWSPAMEKNDTMFYRSWTTRERDRPIYLWLYYCFPEEIATNNGWNAFPGFFAHTVDRQFKMFARDGVRGAFLNNLGDYLDTYVTFRYMDDPKQNVDRLIDEFHRLYYGAAAAPMKKLYLRIEETFTNPANYPDAVRNGVGHAHQTEEMAWRHLGTEERMREFGALMEEAKSLAHSDIERQRVALFDHAIWQYMVEGRRKWLTKQVPAK